jgi:hypothetical protein
MPPLTPPMAITDFESSLPTISTSPNRSRPRRLVRKKSSTPYLIFSFLAALLVAGVIALAVVLNQQNSSVAQNTGNEALSSNSDSSSTAQLQTDSKNTDQTHEVSMDSITDPNAQTVPPGAPDVERNNTSAVEAPENSELQELSIDDAVSIQAPSDPSLRGSDIGDFDSKLYALANNEFKFNRSTTQIHRSTFDQRTTQEGYIADVFFMSKNSVVFPGEYDFENESYSMRLYFWYNHTKPTRAEPVECFDYCRLRANITMPPEIAEQMREEFDRGELSLTVWYRFRRVLKCRVFPEPQSTVGKLAHEIDFEIEVLKYKLD